MASFGQFGKQANPFELGISAAKGTQKTLAKAAKPWASAVTSQVNILGTPVSTDPHKDTSPMTKKDLNHGLTNQTTSGPTQLEQLIDPFAAQRHSQTQQRLQDTRSQLAQLTMKQHKEGYFNQLITRPRPQPTQAEVQEQEKQEKKAELWKQKQEEKKRNIPLEMATKKAEQYRGVAG